MKKTNCNIFVLAFLILPQAVFAQTFQNLNFDSANVSAPGYLGTVPATNALPGWQSSKSFIYYNRADLDQMTIGIYDQNAGQFAWGSHPILGSTGYTAYLEADLGSVFFTYGSFGISQTGVIPADANSLQFFSTIVYGQSLPGYSPTLTFSLNGTPVNYYQIGSAGTFVQYAADVSAFAGKATTLGFQVSATYPLDPPNPHWIFGVGIDGISFSTTPTPEPATGAVLTLGMSLAVPVLARKIATR